jgi:hypothetical protein
MQIIKCIVTRVINHPGEITEDLMLTLKEQVSAATSDPMPRATGEDQDPNTNVDTSKRIIDMPRNTILAAPVGLTHSVKDLNEKIICYPFFSSHFCLPVKEGEFVWVFAEADFEDEDNLGAGPFYWMSRVHGSLLSEDVSFTHFERAWEQSNLRFSDDDKKNNAEVKDMMKAYKPKFMGTIFADHLSDAAMTSIKHQIEPVPRYTKNSGDLVLQGSHNTTLSLGTSIDTFETSSIDPPTKTQYQVNLGAKIPPRPSYNPSTPNAGAIDIVVGRSNNLLDLLEAEKDLNVAWPLSGEPRTVENALGMFEVKKNPSFIDVKGEDPENPISHARFFNMQEGDPDINTDASRIYMFRDDDPDELLRISDLMANSLYEGEDPGEKAKGSNQGGQTAQFESLVEYNKVYPMFIDSTGPGIIAKSKNIRIVARSVDDQKRSVWWMDKKDGDPDNAEEIKLPGEQGSIVLIKEGKMEGEIPRDSLERPPTQIDTGEEEGPFAIEHASDTGNGRAVIAMAADGTIYIDGPRIVIGSGKEKDNGAGTQVSFGLDAYEPTILGNQLHGILSAIINVLDNHIHPTGTGPSGKRVPGGDEIAPGAFTNTVDDISDLKLMLSKIAKTK